MPKRSKAPPPGYEDIEPVIQALENELRDKVKESPLGKRNTESMWPVLQINWQRSRYVYDMYYTYQRISKKVYEYCLRNKIADQNLIAKWKKTGYERLCSTHVINPANYKFGTTSICRVPMKDRSEEQKTAQDPTTGCLGCASGKDAGPLNIFGNKYGQNLAAIQIAREKRVEEMMRKKEEERIRREQEEESSSDDSDDSSEDEDESDEEDNKKQPAVNQDNKGDEQHNDDDDSDEDSSDDEDYGPTPAAGVWAGSKKLEAESEAMINNENEVDDERPAKKARSS